MALLDRKQDLEAAGFRHVATKPVALPYQVWYVNLLVEYDRELRLLEEETLKLIASGLHDRFIIAKLLGLEDDEAFRQVLVGLLHGTYASYHEEGLYLTTLGQSVLVKAKARISRLHEGVPLRFDPYRDEFTWYTGKTLLNISTVKKGGLSSLPEAAKLQADVLVERHTDVERLIRLTDIPNAPGTRTNVDLLLLEPLRDEPVYLRADMEVWLRQEDRAVDWRLLQDGVELSEATRTLKDLEDEGVRIVPNFN